jgi:hypothetical protein
VILSIASAASISSGDLRPGHDACTQVRQMITRWAKIRNTGKFTTPIPLLRWHVNCLCLGGSGCGATSAPLSRRPPRLHQTPHGNHVARLLTLISSAPGAPLCKPAKIRTPYVGQAAGTWFSGAHALLKNRKTGARQICFLAAEVTTDQVRGILSVDKTECGSHVSSGRAAASPLRSPAFRDTTRQRFAG